MNEPSQTTEKSKIANFIKSINDKNYAQANKYLQKTIHQKLTNKISQSKTTPIFQKS
jgi:SLT domain-containing protein